MSKTRNHGEPYPSICPKCSEPRTRADYYKGRHRECKQCHDMDTREWQRRNRDKLRCDRRKRERVRSEQHREERNAWRTSHPDLHAEIVALRKQIVLARREHAKAMRRGSVLARKRTNSRNWYAQNKDIRATYLREWKRKNQGRCNEYSRRRDARKAGNYTEKDPAVAAFYELVRTAPRMICYICHRPIPKKDRTVDHVSPLALNGPHVASNLACACRSCNCRKKDKPPEAVGLLPLWH